jgi:hypothetical protein
MLDSTGIVPVSVKYDAHAREERSEDLHIFDEAIES